MKPSNLWTIGVCLVVLGIAAHWFGWDALLWFPRSALEWLFWLPAMIADTVGGIIAAVEASPSTVGLVVLGIVLMIVAKLWMRPKG